MYLPPPFPLLRRHVRAEIPAIRWLTSWSPASIIITSAHYEQLSLLLFSWLPHCYEHKYALIARGIPNAQRLSHAGQQMPYMDS